MVDFLAGVAEGFCSSSLESESESELESELLSSLSELLEPVSSEDSLEFCSSSGTCRLLEVDAEGPDAELLEDFNIGSDLMELLSGLVTRLERLRGINMPRSCVEETSLGHGLFAE